MFFMPPIPFQVIMFTSEIHLENSKMSLKTFYYVDH